MTEWFLKMKLYVGVTDRDWFNLLSSQNQLEEVNFWQPSGNRQFKALEPGELFLFKLHSPDNYIVGGGTFAHASILPISLAWETFGQKNGALDILEMRKRVEKYRPQTEDRLSDYPIGCILLEQPFFLSKDAWIPVPLDWKLNIVQGRHYDLSIEPGQTLWKQLENALHQSLAIQDRYPLYGEPTLVFPRLGQGSFRVLVTDAYQRRCAITNERTLPALDAAHIKPFSENGPNEVTNGILLRRDLHALFDRGYLTITPSYKVEVSRKIKEEFENGRDYYKYQGENLYLPTSNNYCPSQKYLEWHNSKIYKG